MEGHPNYVQQLCHQCWLNTDQKCSEATILESHDQLILQLSHLFQNLTDTLSTKQVNLIEAMIDGANALSSSKTIKTYKLGTSATVNRSQKALIGKEILDDFSGQMEFVDPAYKAWLSKYYFKKPYLKQ